MALHSHWILLWAMSLITVHTISVNKQPDDKLVALNTSMISQLQEAEGHAYFKFAPKANRAFWYLVKEDMAFVLSAIHDTTAFDITLSTTGGNVTLSTDDIVMAYLHPSEDRIWVQYNYSGNIQLLVAKYRLDDFVKLVNAEQSLAAKGGLISTNNLSDVSSTSTSLNNLGGIGEYLVAIWAEENAVLTNTTYQWAFGDGANTPADGGLTVYVPTGWECHVVAMSLRIGGGVATAELVLNGVPQGANCDVTVISVAGVGKGNTDDSFSPISIIDNSYINFRTSGVDPNTSAPNVVTAWLRYRQI